MMIATLLGMATVVTGQRIFPVGGEDVKSIV